MTRAVYCFFLKSEAMYSHDEKEEKILFNFWLAEKLQSRVESERSLVKTEDKTINLGEMENFVLILEVMTDESLEEKMPSPCGRED